MRRYILEYERPARDRIYFEFALEMGELFGLQGGLGSHFELSDADFDGLRGIGERVSGRRLQIFF